MHRSRRRHNQVAVEEPDRRLAAVLHPDAGRNGFDNQLYQFLGLYILLARLVALLIIIATLSKEASLPAAAAATSASAAPAAATSTAPTAATRAALAGG